METHKLIGVGVPVRVELGSFCLVVLAVPAVLAVRVLTAVCVAVALCVVLAFAVLAFEVEVAVLLTDRRWIVVGLLVVRSCVPLALSCLAPTDSVVPALDAAAVLAVPLVLDVAVVAAAPAEAAGLGGRSALGAGEPDVPWLDGPAADGESVVALVGSDGVGVGVGDELVELELELVVVCVELGEGLGCSCSHCGPLPLTRATARADGALDWVGDAVNVNPAAAVTRTLPVTRLKPTGRTCAKRMKALPVLFVAAAERLIQYDRSENARLVRYAHHWTPSSVHGATFTTTPLDSISSRWGDPGWICLHL